MVHEEVHCAYETCVSAPGDAGAGHAKTRKPRKRENGGNKVLGFDTAHGFLEHRIGAKTAKTRKRRKRRVVGEECQVFAKHQFQKNGELQNRTLFL